MRFQSITQFRAVSHRLSISNCIFTFVSFVSFFFAAEAQPAVTQPGAVELYPIKAPTGPARRWSAGTGCDNAPPACSPAILHRKISTAFGEPMSTVNGSGFDPSRYGYAGAYGYEEPRTGDPLALLGWLHVGERYCAPELGRFVQRDPIGIRGGSNVYLYAMMLPSQLTDSTGLYWEYDDVTNPDGSITRHFYDRGWTGWFKHEYKYSVRVPHGMPLPLPPRTIDQRVVAVCVSTEVVMIGGGIRGAFTGGPQGMVFGGISGGCIGFVGGVVREACY